MYSRHLRHTEMCLIPAGPPCEPWFWWVWLKLSSLHFHFRELWDRPALCSILLLLSPAGNILPRTKNISVLLIMSRYSALDCGRSGLGSSPGRVHCVELLRRRKPMREEGVRRECRPRMPLNFCLMLEWPCHCLTSLTRGSRKQC